MSKSMWAMSRLGRSIATRSSAPALCRCCRLNARFVSSSQSVHAKGKGGGGGGGGGAEKFDLTKVIPVNLKQGGEEPQYLPDEEYPSWLFELLEEDPTIEELKSRGAESLSYKELRRVIRSERRKLIQERNLLDKKA